MKIVKVRLGKKSYDIHIGKNAINKIPSILKASVPDGPLFVVTNRKINKLHGKKLKKVLSRVSKRVLFCEVPASEKAKSFMVYMQTIKKLAKFSRKIKPLVIAFGGGVVGDLAGFVASAYRRGVPYIQVPTTLLAQVDSAVGGKVAIDIKEAKNIVGNFYQPKAVLCDLRFLKTLPEKEIRNGLAEIVKYGIIKDEKLFSFLEKNLSSIVNLNDKALEYVVYRSCKIKAAVVEKDEYDVKDVRAILNFGHTFGHAIEAASAYSQAVKHGQAIAKGMTMASFLALKLNLLGKKDHARISSLVKKITTKTKSKEVKTKRVLEAIAYDKKFIYGVNRFILPKRIGCVKIVDRVPQGLIRKAIEENIKK